MMLQIALKKNLKTIVLIKNIPLIEDFSKEELGIAIGREEVKVLAITDKNMAEKLMFLYKRKFRNKLTGGDFIVKN